MAELPSPFAPLEAFALQLGLPDGVVDIAIGLAFFLWGLFVAIRGAADIREHRGEGKGATWRHAVGALWVATMMFVGGWNFLYGIKVMHQALVADTAASASREEARGAAAALLPQETIVANLKTYLS